MHAADANILIDHCRVAAQQYFLTYQEPMPCEQLVRLLCDVKQGYTQRGGQRPFGVSLLYAGWYGCKSLLTCMPSLSSLLCLWTKLGCWYNCRGPHTHKLQGLIGLGLGVQN
jgi:hypothetical protein